MGLYVRACYESKEKVRILCEVKCMAKPLDPVIKKEVVYVAEWVLAACMLTQGVCIIAGWWSVPVMLGNLLDDALEACKKQASYDRRIYASIRNNGKCMYLNVEYTCDGEQTNNSIGSKISSQLVNYYNGRLESSNVNGIHKTTAILRP